MAWEWLKIFRRDPKEGHEALFDLEQGAIAERRAAEALEDLAEVAAKNLQTLRRIEQGCRGVEGQGEHMAEAARAYHEGLATLLAVPPGLFPAEREARLEAMARPSNGSLGSPPRALGVEPGPGPKALPGQASPPSPQGEMSTPASSAASPAAGNPADGQPPRRKRGRPRKYPRPDEGARGQGT